MNKGYKWWGWYVWGHWNMGAGAQKILESQEIAREAGCHMYGSQKSPYDRS